MISDVDQNPDAVGELRKRKKVKSGYNCWMCAPKIESRLETYVHASAGRGGNAY